MTTESPDPEGTGTWRDHSYAYSEPDGGRTAVTFTPVLPGDDAVVIAAVTHLSQLLYQLDVSSAHPHLESRMGQTVMAFPAGSSRVLVFAIKEETGEVHSLTMWRE